MLALLRAVVVLFVGFRWTSVADTVKSKCLTFLARGTRARRISFWVLVFVYCLSSVRTFHISSLSHSSVYVHACVGVCWVSSSILSNVNGSGRLNALIMAPSFMNLEVRCVFRGLLPMYG